MKTPEIKTTVGIYPRIFHVRWIASCYRLITKGRRIIRCELSGHKIDPSKKFTINKKLFSVRNGTGRIRLARLNGVIDPKTKAAALVRAGDINN